MQEAIAGATGVSVELAADTELVDRIPAWPHERFRKRPMILIGNIGNNRGIVPLYGNLLAGADSKYPGGKGYTVRTVVDPYGTGVNEIVLGASATAGMSKAVQAFADLVKKHGRKGALELPGLLAVAPGGEYVQLTTKAGASALNYQWTGDKALLQAAVRKVRGASYMKPGTEFYNPGHYGKESEVRGLIALIQSGALEPGEVNHIESILLAGLHKEYGGYWIVHNGDWLGTRHQTMGMMGFLVTADYLLNRAKPNAAAAAFLKKCVDQGHAFFHQFDENYRDEGNDNTSFHSAGAIGRYAMAFGNTGFFESGAAKLMARRALMVTDNRGWFIAPGNYEDVRQGRIACGVATKHSVALPAFVYRDGQLRWLVENAPGIGALDGRGWGFDSGIACGRYPLGSKPNPVEPRDWLGVSVLPLQSYYYDLCGHYMTHTAKRRKHPWEPLIPREKAVEMLVFRDRFAPAAQYLFISGYQGGRYNNIDANAILRYADRGHVWLISQTERFGHYFRNALHVASGHRDDYYSMAGTIRLDASANYPDAGMTATTLPHSNGADWTRHVLWARGKYFVVIDTARFLENGDYDLTCTWRSLPIAGIENGVWVARYLDARFELHNADGIEQRSCYERARATEQMCVYPYTLRQHAAVKGRKGGHFSVRNLFFTLPRDVEGGYRVEPAGKDAAVISDGKGYFALAGVTLKGNTRIGPLSTDARMFLVGTDSVRLTPEGSRLRLGGKQIAPGKATAEVKAALKDIWSAAKSPRAPALERDRKKKAPGPDGVAPAWSYDGFARLHQEIGGVSVVKPVGIEPPDRLFDRQCLVWNSGYRWPEGTRTVTYDLGRVETLAEIRLDGSYSAAHREKNPRNPYWSRRGGAPVKIAFSNNRSGGREMPLPYDHIYRMDPPAIYKPYSYFPKVWKQFPPAGEPPLGIKARYVRAPTARDCHQVAFYRTATRPAQFDRLEPVDFDGDGRDEIAVATEARQLVVLNGDGTPRWSKTLENTVTDLFAIDLNGNGRQVLLVADNGWYVRGYNGQGARVYDVDCKKAGIRGAYALGSVIPRGSRHAHITVATGTGAVCLNPAGGVHSRIAEWGVASDVVLRGSSSAPLAKHRTASRHAWGGGTWRDIPGGTGKFGCYWWHGLGFEFWPETGAPQDSTWQDGLAVFVARAGVNAYGMGRKTPSKEWALPASGPLSAYAFANMDGRPGAELVLGRLDGFIHVVDRSGKVIGTWATKGPVKDLCAWKGRRGAVIAVAMTDTIRFHDGNGDERGRISVSAERLGILRSPAAQTLICAGGDGKIVALGPPSNQVHLYRIGERREGEQPVAGGPESLRRPKATEEAVFAWDAKLRARLRGDVAAGRSVEPVEDRKPRERMARQPRRPEAEKQPPRPKTDETDRAAAKLFREAETAFIDGDADRAKELFTSIIGRHPGSPFASKAREYLEMLE